MKKLIVILLFFAAVSMAQAPMNKPLIWSPNRTHNFGDLREGQIVAHNFKIFNRGGDTLRITKLRSSCGCTVANVGSKVLAPGDSTLIRVTFNTKNKRGVQRKTIFVLSNDPYSPRLKFTLNATVYGKNDNIEMIKKGPKLKLQTYQLQLGKIDEGTIKTTHIKYKNVGKYPLTIQQLKTSSKFIKVIPNKLKLKPNEIGEAEIKIDTKGLQGSLARTVMFYSNDPLDSIQMLTIFFSINKDKK